MWAHGGLMSLLDLQIWHTLELLTFDEKFPTPNDPPLKKLMEGSFKIVICFSRIVFVLILSSYFSLKGSNGVSPSSSKTRALELFGLFNDIRNSWEHAVKLQGFLLGPQPLQSLALVASPKLGLRQKVSFHHIHKLQMPSPATPSNPKHLQTPFPKTSMPLIDQKLVFTINV